MLQKKDLPNFRMPLVNPFGGFTKEMSRLLRTYYDVRSRRLIHLVVQTLFTAVDSVLATSGV
jgi:hypothetical protein